MLNIKALYNNNNKDNIILYIPSCNNNKDIIINNKICYNIIYDIDSKYINTFIDIIIPWIENLQLGNGIIIIINNNDNYTIFCSTYLTENEKKTCIENIKNLTITTVNYLLTPIELSIKYILLQNPKYICKTILLIDKIYYNDKNELNDIISNFKLLGITNILMHIGCDYNFCKDIKSLNKDSTITFIINEISLKNNFNKYLLSLNSYSIGIKVNNIYKYIPSSYNITDNFIVFDINYCINPIIIIYDNLGNQIYINYFNIISDNICNEYFRMHMSLNKFYINIITIYDVMINDLINIIKHNINYKNINIIDEKIKLINKQIKIFKLCFDNFNITVIPNYINLIYLLNYINTIRCTVHYFINIKIPKREIYKETPIKVIDIDTYNILKKNFNDKKIYYFNPYICNTEEDMEIKLHTIKYNLQIDKDYNINLNNYNNNFNSTLTIITYLISCHPEIIK